MPRKTKIVKEADRRATLKLMDSIPAHIKARVGKRSQISESLRTEGIYNWNGHGTLDEQLALHPSNGTTENNRRKENSQRWALTLPKKYPELLWKREGARIIADKERVHASSVRRAKNKLK